MCKMYFIQDKTAYIARLQRMLGLPQSGRIDKRTRTLIDEIKKEYGVSSSEIDYKTFLAIKKYAYKRKIGSGFSDIHPFEASVKMKEINLLLCALIRFYSISYRAPRGSVYGYDSQRIVKRLRQIYRISVSDSIDGELMYYINKDISSLNANNLINSSG